MSEPSKSANRSLFKNQRECVCCGAKQDYKREGLIAISGQLYTFFGCRRLQAVKRVLICEACFVIAMTSYNSKQAVTLFGAVSERLIASYNEVKELSIAVPVPSGEVE